MRPISGVRIGDRLSWIRKKSGIRIGTVRDRAHKTAGPVVCGRGSQVERFGKSTLEGPRIFIAPDVFSHDKNAHTAVAVRTIVHPSNIMVHPAEDKLIIIDGCGGSEVIDYDEDRKSTRLNSS